MMNEEEEDFEEELYRRRTITGNDGGKKGWGKENERRSRKGRRPRTWRRK
jgi:hypothetical protein